MSLSHLLPCSHCGAGLRKTRARIKANEAPLALDKLRSARKHEKAMCTVHIGVLCTPPPASNFVLET